MMVEKMVAMMVALKAPMMVEKMVVELEMMTVQEKAVMTVVKTADL